MIRNNKRPSRSKLRIKQLRDAQQTAVPQTADVCVVGGGAAGLVAAIVAARKGVRVVVLERDLTCGQTILATGNGRCNFANKQLDPTLYNEADFVLSTCGDEWLEDVLTFFASCGLAWEEEAEGRLYPLSRQAASVRNVLLLCAKQSGAVLAPAREVTKIAKKGQGFAVTMREQWENGQEQCIHAATVVFASGGNQTSLNKELGIALNAQKPVLCPIACTHPLLRQLDGRRVRATATLCRNNANIAVERGEVLFRTYGLSGIAIFNLSRFAQTRDVIRLDLLPTIGTKDALALCVAGLDGLFDPIVSQVLLDAVITPERAIALAKSFELTVDGLANTDHAQIRRGGFATNQFDAATLEARQLPGFFACGEAVDVDGPCGGYNLAWAWKSGSVAGQHAARKALQ